MAAPASATTVATISGCYDCFVFDTPSLQINNTSGGSFTNAQMVLHGYQADNNGLTATVNLGTIANGASPQENWGSLPGVSGSTSPGNMTAYDYDDQYIGTSLALSTPNCGGGGCVSGGGQGWYAQVGNFYVTFTATISGGPFDGDSVFAEFSPSNNATGGFVSWEGLDANGFSEQLCCDIHSGSITGDLANINLGSPPPTFDPGPPAGSAVPEPATWAMLLVGVGMAGATLRRRARVLISA